MYRRKLAFSIEAAIVALACVTLGLAIKYAIQLWNAPVYGGDVNNTRPSRTTIIPEYSILPVITIVAGLFNMALHVASGVRALYAVIVSSLLATAWLVMIAIWGQCHLQAHDNPDNPWYEGMSLTPHIIEESRFAADELQSATRPTSRPTISKTTSRESPRRSAPRWLLLVL